MVKTGMALLDIQESTGGKFYFAAYRFFLAGLMIFGGVWAAGKPLTLSRRSDYGAMVLTGLLQTTLQYIFFYIGLSNTTAVKASIIISSGSLVLFFLGLALDPPSVLAFDGRSLALLVYLSFLSAAAFSLWYILIQYNRLSSIAVYRFLIPICAALLSVALLESERLDWPALVALVMVCAGIVLTSRE
jgi:drug/metabolite transporter (DMT)-like permease